MPITCPSVNETTTVVGFSIGRQGEDATLWRHLWSWEHGSIPASRILGGLTAGVGLFGLRLRIGLPGLHASNRPRKPHTCRSLH